MSLGAHHWWSLFLFSGLGHSAFTEEPLKCSQGSVSLGHLLIGSRPLKLLPIDLHFHDKAFVVAASSLRDELVLQAAALLVQLHHGVLAMFGQDWSLLASSLTGKIDDK